jgi:hypothetical protein
MKHLICNVLSYLVVLRRLRKKTDIGVIERSVTMRFAKESLESWQVYTPIEPKYTCVKCGRIGAWDCMQTEEFCLDCADEASPDSMDREERYWLENEI